MPNTTKGYPYPQGSDAVDVPGDIQALADAVDASPGVTSYTSTQIAALTAGEKWAGRVIWNSTAGKLQVSNGSTFSDVDTSVALSSSTPQTLGTAAAGTSSDASRADHRHAMPSASDVGAIGISLVTAKGQIIAASGSATPAAVPTGSTNGHILTWDTAEATSMKWAAAPASGIPATLLDAKGDLIVASAADTAARLAVGTNGQALLADSTAATGLRWGAVGKVLQVVSTTKTDTFSTTSAGSWIDITGLSASITPSATSSLVLAIVNVNGGSSTNGQFHLRLVRGSTAIGTGTATGNRQGSSGVVSIPNNDRVWGSTWSYLDSPSANTATTYKVQIYMPSSEVTGATSYVNRHGNDTDNDWRSRQSSTITLLEIGA